MHIEDLIVIHIIKMIIFVKHIIEYLLRNT